MKLKKFAVGVIAIGTAFTLAACGGTETNGEDTLETDPATEQQELPVEDPATETDPVDPVEPEADEEVDPEEEEAQQFTPYYKWASP